MKKGDQFDIALISDGWQALLTIHGAIWVAAELCSKQKIKKYPTMRLLRDGQQTRREYRGQRSVQSIIEFMRVQLKDPIVNLTSLDDLDNLDVSNCFCSLKSWNNCLKHYWAMVLAAFVLFISVIVSKQS
jgi:hypothetical protein